MRFSSWRRNVRTPGKGQDPCRARRILHCAVTFSAVLVIRSSSSMVRRSGAAPIFFITAAVAVAVARHAFGYGTGTVFDRKGICEQLQDRSGFWFAHVPWFVVLFVGCCNLDNSDLSRLKSKPICQISSVIVRRCSEKTCSCLYGRRFAGNSWT